MLIGRTERDNVAVRQRGAGYRELAERLFGDLSAAGPGGLIEVLARMPERLRAGQGVVALG